jgi:tripeptidyl-peptidase I
VPSYLTRYIDFVHPGVVLVGSMTKKYMRRSIQPEEELTKREVFDERAAAGPCNNLSFITPACIQHIYGVPKGDKKAPGNSLGLFEHGSWYSPISLATLLANFTDIPPETRPINITIDISETHYDDSFSFDGEADLDIQLALPLVYPQSITIYQVDDDYYASYAPSLETYLGLFQSWLNAIDKVSVFIIVRQCLSPRVPRVKKGADQRHLVILQLYSIWRDRK